MRETKLKFFSLSMALVFQFLPGVSLILVLTGTPLHVHLSAGRGEPAERKQAQGPGNTHSFSRDLERVFDFLCFGRSAPLNFLPFENLLNLVYQEPGPSPLYQIAIVDTRKPNLTLALTNNAAETADICNIITILIVFRICWGPDLDLHLIHEPSKPGLMFLQSLFAYKVPATYYKTAMLCVPLDQCG